MIRKTLVCIIGITMLLSFSAEAGNRHGRDHNHHKKHNHGHHIKHSKRHHRSHHDNHHGCRHADYFEYASIRPRHWGARFDVNMGIGYTTNGAIIYVPPRVQLQGVIGY